MNGPHDLGGKPGFGPVTPEPNERAFHADWERRAMGMTLCSGALGAWTLDESRHARESLPPDVYLNSSYYRIWTLGLETLLQRHGFLTANDLKAGQPIDPAPKPKCILKAEGVSAAMARGGPCDRKIDTTPRFAASDRVRTRNVEPTGHTRLPTYARNKAGVIEAVREAYVLPDTNAHAQGENPEWVYTIVFEGRELWGAGAAPGHTVSIDAWESYLEPA
ncbi:MAG: nitrile hydratase subunit beta [Hyphomonadaceae bacterium]|nr:nitrile hydratase subunit beta [Hyphomonadaceae bacterium]